MFVVMYRWRLKAGSEARFAEAWSERTRDVMRHEGGLGSRLHRVDDGSYLAYAQWPTRANWESFYQKTGPASPQAQVFRECVESSEAPVCLEVVRDLLVRD